MTQTVTQAKKIVEDSIDATIKTGYRNGQMFVNIVAPTDEARQDLFDQVEKLELTAPWAVTVAQA